MEEEGLIKTPEAGLTLLLPFIQREIPAEPALRAYALLLATGIRTGNVATAITKGALTPFGAGKIDSLGVYEALEVLGSSLEAGPITLPGASEARVVAVDVHVPQKFGKDLQERYNPMRGRPTKTIPTVMVAEVSAKHADPLLVEVLEDAGERGPQLLLRLLPRLSALGLEILLFDGELSSKEAAQSLSARGMGFIGRLRSDTLLARRLKPLMLEENRIHSMKVFHQDWGGWVTVFGFLRGDKRFYYLSNLDAPAEKLKGLFGWKWRLENFFRDSSFMDEFPGCDMAKARAHTFIASLLGRVTGAFQAAAKTIRLLLRAVERATISRGRLVVEFQALPERLVKKLRSYVSYLHERLGVDASLQPILGKANANT